MAELLTDIICQVLANQYSESVVFDTLDKFIPNRQKLHLDYAVHPQGRQFQSENEMVKYFVTNKMPQTFYWNEAKITAAKLMIGANITSDSKLIMSLTFDGSLLKAESYLDDLMRHLDSEVGVISHTIPAKYENGEDFRTKYRKQAA